MSTFLLSLLIQTVAYAQIEIHSSDLVPLASDGFATTVWAVDSGSFPLLQSIFEQTGENQVFDFTGIQVLSPTTSSTAVFPSSSGTPWDADPDFGVANRVTLQESGDADSWSFWIANSTSLRNLGSIITHDVNGDGTEDTTRIRNDPADTHLLFPVRFGMSWQESFTQTSTAFGSATESTQDHEAAVDGWGRLDTPVGSAPVLRFKETRLTTTDLGGNPVQSRFTLVTFYSKVGLSAFILANESDEVIAGAYSVADSDGTGIRGFDRSDAAFGPLYPNPFVDVVTLPFALEQTGRVQIRVFDLTGRIVETVVDDYFTAGTHSL
ncbi:MAG: hypothetical protein R3282_07020, partial [Rhodothermales bacterium]|nr:hypothetical protein [Rhodothermales bacterium]